MVVMIYGNTDNKTIKSSDFPLAVERGSISHLADMVWGVERDKRSGSAPPFPKLYTAL